MIFSFAQVVFCIAPAFYKLPPPKSFCPPIGTMRLCPFGSGDQGQFGGVQQQQGDGDKLDNSLQCCRSHSRRSRHHTRHLTFRHGNHPTLSIFFKAIFSLKCHFAFPRLCLEVPGKSLAKITLKFNFYPLRLCLAL